MECILYQQTHGTSSPWADSRSPKTVDAATPTDALLPFLSGPASRPARHHHQPAHGRPSPPPSRPTHVTPGHWGRNVPHVQRHGVSFSLPGWSKRSRCKRGKEGRPIQFSSFAGTVADGVCCRKSKYRSIRRQTLFLPDILKRSPRLALPGHTRSDAREPV